MTRALRAHVVILLLACASVHARPAVAHALESDAPCRSRSERSLTSAVVRYRAGALAVWIAPGETLCLALTSPARPGPADVSVVPSGPRASVVSVTLAVDANGSVLRVQNPLPHVLRYRAAIPESRQALRESYVLPVQARGEATEAWNWPLTGLALFDLRLADGEADPLPGGPPAPSVELGQQRHRRSAISVGAGFGMTWNSLDELNADLQGHGFGAQRSLQPLTGFDLALWVGRFALSTDFLFGLTRAVARDSPDLHQSIIALHAAYSVFLGNMIRIAPMLGIGLGFVQLDVDPEAPPLSIDGVEELPEKDAFVERDVGLLLGSLDASYRWPVASEQSSGLNAFYLALRAGYGWQFSQSGWRAGTGEDDVLRGGPEIDTSGAYVRISFGFVAGL